MRALLSWVGHFPVRWTPRRHTLLKRRYRTSASGRSIVPPSVAALKLPPLRVGCLARVALHADLTMLTPLGRAPVGRGLSRLPLTAAEAEVHQHCPEGHQCSDRGPLRHGEQRRHREVRGIAAIR